MLPRPGKRNSPSVTCGGTNTAIRAYGSMLVETGATVSTVSPRAFLYQKDTRTSRAVWLPLFVSTPLHQSAPSSSQRSITTLGGKSTDPPPPPSSAPQPPWTTTSSPPTKTARSIRKEPLSSFTRVSYFFLFGLRYAPTLSNAFPRLPSTPGVGGYLGSGLSAEFTSDVTSPPRKLSLGSCSMMSVMSFSLCAAA